MANCFGDHLDNLTVRHPRVCSEGINMDLYADITMMGGLKNALQSVLKDLGCDLGVVGQTILCVATGQRNAQITINKEKRLFNVDLWSQGVRLASGGTPHLPELARVILEWVTTTCKVADLATKFKYVIPEDKAAAFEKGTGVEEQWQTLLRPWNTFGLTELITSCSHRPKLRLLFPYVELNMLRFSRCTGSPYTRDTPCAQFANGKYHVYDPHYVVIGTSSVAEKAADFINSNLPAFCGPAVPGTCITFKNGQQ